MNTAKRIRAVLRANDEGLTPRELAPEIGMKDHRDILYAVRRMPDAYIDRWVVYKDPMGRTLYTPVWCVVVPPENCPKPFKG